MYPYIDKNKCIDCGICIKVCQCYNAVQNKDIIFTVYARHNSEERRMQSQSGGLFSAIAEVILKLNGVCYGAAICDDMVVRCVRICTVEELDKLKGSKYVQCDYSGSFISVENDLKNDRFVLFSGTSCVVDGLIKYLTAKGRDMSKLYTCDIICHGVPSPKMIEGNIDRIERENNKTVKYMKYRDKNYGWSSHIETYVFEDDTYVSDDSYTDLFYSHLAFRECCFSCMYANIKNKNSDITVGDFWGIRKTDEEDDNKGWSVAFVRSQKMFDLVKKADAEMYELKKELAWAENRVGNVRIPFKYDAFWSDYEKKGFMYVLKKYSIYGGIPFRAKRKILMKLKQW